ncbi:deoxyribonuclease-1-like isoform X1 [Centruroides vittatus]|uniref:deoxyribonuclease-1-like isoform X1 n=1 Tax=Centruroides vittatus TaxID=120091 RepID=UPI00350EA9A1
MIISILFFASFLVFLHGHNCQRETIQPHLRVASFNVQTFGYKKYNKKDAADIIKKIITRYDFICLQEIVVQKKPFLGSLLKDINYVYSSKKPYVMNVSPPVGTNSTTKEQYLYLYRKDRLEFLDARVYPDPKNRFIRPPYIAYVDSSTTRSLSRFVSICVHTRPSDAANEIDALAEVYDYAKNLYDNENALIMGDLNAGCKYVRTNDWANISLRTRPEFQWLINSSIDTTSHASSCAYDRIIITGSEMKRDTIHSSVRPFYYQAEYNITEKLVKEVSDHVPVEFSLRGKVSRSFVENIHADICIRVYDRRPSDTEISVLKNRNISGFDVEFYDDVERCRQRLIITKKATNSRDLISSLKDLNVKMSNVLSSETVETIDFKSDHGALLDCGSYNTVTHPEYKLTINCYSVTDICTVYLCRQTFLN